MREHGSQKLEYFEGPNRQSKVEGKMGGDRKREIEKDESKN